MPNDLITMDEIYGVYEKWKESCEGDWWDGGIFGGESRSIWRMLDINFWYPNDDIDDEWAVTIYKCLFNTKEGYWNTNVTDEYIDVTDEFKWYVTEKERENKNA